MSCRVIGFGIPRGLLVLNRGRTLSVKYTRTVEAPILTTDPHSNSTGQRWLVKGGRLHIMSVMTLWACTWRSIRSFLASEEARTYIRRQCPQPPKPISMSPDPPRCGTFSASIASRFVGCFPGDPRPCGTTNSEQRCRTTWTARSSRWESVQSLAFLQLTRLRFHNIAPANRQNRRAS